MPTVPFYWHFEQKQQDLKDGVSSEKDVKSVTGKNITYPRSLN
jgi:hypothetical protein